ncbi:competence protein ComGB [Enterococcus sp. PF1-24]|uniref:competence type IV pilus assembly protein ComGB n=1 Tax=unclassified Enterococcus TaxID=2608891 RepID=UPI00247598F4|nr:MULTISPECIES: competence type IV pilus assembly protein ComGB [unclassified Enterococcus]MDH6365555.1 competence protein ComGB [Enterococcus sp. PFB1-1]MDH6402655.1 competence protein ComGB [Enterococcus sp. PF1-24]
MLKKKISLLDKQRFAGNLADLLEHGFSFKESLQFMAKTDSFNQRLLKIFQKNLALGRPLSYSFLKAEYSPQQITQIRFAEMHGNLITTLKSMERQMLLMAKQRKELQKVVTYPCLLLLFLVGIMFALRQIILPQLLAGGIVDEKHLAIRFLQEFPLYLGGIAFLVMLLVLISKVFFRQVSPLKKATFLSKLPFFRKYYQTYLSGHFSLEWGKLFQEGLELKQVLFCMKKTPKQNVMREMALELEKGMRQGRTLVEQLQKYPFLTREFLMIVEQGEVKGKLGSELVIYSELVSQRFFRQMEKLMTFIQPLIFLLVAVLIILVYSAMLLPIYGNMEDLI